MTKDVPITQRETDLMLSAIVASYLTLLNRDMIKNDQRTAIELLINDFMGRIKDKKMLKIVEMV